MQHCRQYLTRYYYWQAGILLSYWENEEPVGSSTLFNETLLWTDTYVVKSEHLYIPETTDDLKLSPVYSLAVQNQSLWLLSGLEVFKAFNYSMNRTYRCLYRVVVSIFNQYAMMKERLSLRYENTLRQLVYSRFLQTKGPFYPGVGIGMSTIGT